MVGGPRIEYIQDTNKERLVAASFESRRAEKVPVNLAAPFEKTLRQRLKT